MTDVTDEELAARAPEADSSVRLLVEAWARSHDVVLWRAPMATPAEVARVRCPMHGWGDCIERNMVLRRGCLWRQIEALRVDHLPPAPACAHGEVGRDQCEGPCQ